MTWYSVIPLCTPFLKYFFGAPCSRALLDATQATLLASSPDVPMTEINDESAPHITVFESVQAGHLGFFELSAEKASFPIVTSLGLSASENDDVSSGAPILDAWSLEPGAIRPSFSVGVMMINPIATTNCSATHTNRIVSADVVVNMAKDATHAPAEAALLQQAVVDAIVTRSLEVEQHDLTDHQASIDSAHVIAIQRAMDRFFSSIQFSSHEVAAVLRLCTDRHEPLVASTTLVHANASLMHGDVINIDGSAYPAADAKEAMHKFDLESTTEGPIMETPATPPNSRRLTFCSIFGAAALASQPKIASQPKMSFAQRVSELHAQAAAEAQQAAVDQALL